MQQMISCCEIKKRLYETQLREGKADGDGRVELCDKVNICLIAVEVSYDYCKRFYGIICCLLTQLIHFMLLLDLMEVP